MKSVFTIFSLFACMHLLAQSPTCGQDMYLDYLEASDPAGFSQAHSAHHANIDYYRSQHPNPSYMPHPGDNSNAIQGGSNCPTAEYILPVVVHVMYGSSTLVDSARAERQIDILNQWYRNTKISTIEDANIFIDDTPALTVLDLKAKARRMKRQRGLDMIIIDYLQLMRAEEGNKSAGNREQEISYISRSLKGLAKELDIPVIALAQLSRAVEARQDKRPMLSDLRESGSIEQDADLVTFIFRPEYYGITQDEEGNDNEGLTEIIIRKHRNGSPGTVNLKFIKHFGKFSDWGYSDYGADTFTDTSVTYGSKMNEEISPFDPGENSPF